MRQPSSAYRGRRPESPPPPSALRRLIANPEIKIVRKPLRHIPSDAELAAIPLVEPTTLEISDRETMKLRRRLYALNRDNAAWRYRTMRENGLTLLWRLTR
jgi:hypothetical protein